MAPDYIYDSRHLCARLRTDGIKAMSRGLSRGKQVKNIVSGRNRRVEFVYSRQQEMKTFLS